MAMIVVLELHLERSLLNIGQSAFRHLAMQYGPVEHGITCFSFGWNVKFDGENICKYFRNNFHK